MSPKCIREMFFILHFGPNASTPWTNLGNKGIRNHSCPQSFGITTFAHISTETPHQAKRVGFYISLSQYRIQIPAIVDAGRWPSPTFKLSYFILSTIFIVQFSYASSRWPSPIQAPVIFCPQKILAAFRPRSLSTCSCACVSRQRVCRRFFTCFHFHLKQFYHHKISSSEYIHLKLDRYFRLFWVRQSLAAPLGPVRTGLYRPGNRANWLDSFQISANGNPLTFYHLMYTKMIPKLGDPVFLGRAG